MNLYLFHKILGRTHDALLHYLMPLNFTFTFLFYTETASLTTILFLYYRVMTLDTSGILNLAIGSYSLLMRQTNIIWINFIVALSILKGDCKVTGVLLLIAKVIRELPQIIKRFWWAVLLDLSFVAFLVINKGSIVLGH